MHNIVIILVFVVFLAFFGLGYLVFPQREFSDMENRYLSTMPEFTWKSFLSGKFAEDFDDYTADQIAGKDLFVQGHVAYSRALGISEVNQVYFGKEGYLIQDYQEPGTIFEDNLSYIQEFASAHPDVNMTFLIAPNASEIYPEYLPDFATTYSQTQVIDTMQTELDASNLTIVDATDTLMEHKAEDIFYKTDHHWTSLGAYYAYVELCDALGMSAIPLDNYEGTTIEEPFLGSLYSKAPAFGQESDIVTLYENPDGEYQVHFVNENETVDSMYDMDYAQKKDKYAIFFGGNYALTVINSNSEHEEKVLVIKDSYANSLIPFLADQYSEIHMMDLRYYHDDVNAYIEEQGITEVIFIHNVDFITTDNCFLWLS